MHSKNAFPYLNEDCIVEDERKKVNKQTNKQRLEFLGISNTNIL